MSSRSQTIARLGIAGLNLPSPTVKLAICHSWAQSLNDPLLCDVAWSTLLRAIRESDLESQVVEALCIPLLSQQAECVRIDELQRAITRPSILSDWLLGEIQGTPLSFRSWASSHSGEVSPLFRTDEFEQRLQSKRFVPPIVEDRFRRLEETFELPFIAQWAHEFENLQRHNGDASNGQIGYFSDDRNDSQGQFITSLGLLARSAYLRALSAAFDLWGVPESVVEAEAKYVTPLMPDLARMTPGTIPTWVRETQVPRQLSEETVRELALNIIRRANAERDLSQLLHLDASIANEENFKCQIEVVTLLSDSEPLDVSQVFSLHDRMPGRVDLPRNNRGQIILTTPNKSVARAHTQQHIAMLRPVVGRQIGYMHSDLLHRIPHVPIPNDRRVTMYAQSKIGGMDVILNNDAIGKVSYWNQTWRPTRPAEMKPSCSVSLHVHPEFFSKAGWESDLRKQYYWRVKVLARRERYDKWQSTEGSGTVKLE